MNYNRAHNHKARSLFLTSISQQRSQFTNSIKSELRYFRFSELYDRPLILILPSLFQYDIVFCILLSTEVSLKLDLLFLIYTENHASFSPHCLTNSSIRLNVVFWTIVSLLNRFVDSFLALLYSIVKLRWVILASTLTIAFSVFIR